MRNIDVPRSVWAEAEEILRNCGSGARECVVYLCGDAGGTGPTRATAVYHPVHEASAVSYDVSISALSELNLWLFRKEISVLVQVHTHPGVAFHSGIDDARPTIETLGFLSLVVPDFGARGLRGLPACYLAEYLGSGNWRDVPRAEMLERICLKE
jgi:hypothetical protein